MRRREKAPREKRRAAKSASIRHIGADCLPGYAQSLEVFNKHPPPPRTDRVDNEFVLDERDQLLARYPFVEFSIYERERKIKNDVSSRKKTLSEIRTYKTDKSKRAGRRGQCAANPFARPRLMNRIKHRRKYRRSDVFASPLVRWGHERAQAPPVSVLSPSVCQDAQRPYCERRNVAPEPLLPPERQ